MFHRYFCWLIGFGTYKLDVSNRHHFFQKSLASATNLGKSSWLCSLYSLDLLGFKGQNFDFQIQWTLWMFVCFQFSNFVAAFKVIQVGYSAMATAVSTPCKNRFIFSTSNADKWSPKHPYEAQGVLNERFFKTGLDVGALRRPKATICPLQGCL